MNAFKKHHKGIENYICSDFGIKAMYYDSLIMEDCLTQLMLRKGIVVLPEHDELFCPHDKINIVKDQMAESYCKVMKTALIENKVLTKSQPLPDHIKPVITLG